MSGFDPKKFASSPNSAFDPKAFLGGSTPQIIQEQHQDISFGDRAKLKNFANSPEAMVSYLKQKNPKAEIESRDGQIIMRQPGEQNYKVLDPDTPMFSMASLKDLPADIADIGYDIADGIGTGAATAAGAVAGTFMAPGAGTVVGGALGGSTSGAASEAARQKIGQSLGIPQEVDMMDVGISGAVGAASPLVFGAGAATKNMTKALGKRYGAEGAEKIAQALAKAERANNGAVSVGYDYTKNTLAPNILEMASGRSADSIRALGRNMDYIDEVAGKGNLVEQVEKYTEQFGKDFEDEVKKRGMKLSSDIEGIGQKIDMRGAKDALREPQDQLQKKAKGELPVRVVKTHDNRLNKMYDDHFKIDSPPEPATFNHVTGKYVSAPTEIADEVSPSAAWLIQRHLKKNSQFDPSAGLVTHNGTAVDESMIKGAARKAYGAINEAFDKASDGLVGTSKKDYKDIVGLEDSLEPYFRDPKKAFQTFDKLDSRGYRVAQEDIKRAQAMGIQSAKDMDKTMAAAQWVNPHKASWKSIPLSGVGLGVGYYGGAQSDMGPGGAYLGGVGGGLIGAALASPAAIKHLVRTGIKGEQLGKRGAEIMQKVAPAQGKRNMTTKGIYDLLRDNEEN